SPGTTEAPYSFKTVVPFIGQGQMPDDQYTATTPITTSINLYETITSDFVTSHTYNHIATIPSFGTTDAFVGQGQTLYDQNTALINSYESFLLELPVHLLVK
ncbi:14120_t:CDS:2, partial [Racocetra fulgida]